MERLKADLASKLGQDEANAIFGDTDKFSHDGYDGGSGIFVA